MARYLCASGPFMHIIIGRISSSPRTRPAFRAVIQISHLLSPFPRRFHPRQLSNPFLFSFSFVELLRKLSGRCRGLLFSTEVFTVACLH